MKQYIGILNKTWLALLLATVLFAGFLTITYHFAAWEAFFTGRKAVIVSYGLMLIMVVCVFAATKGTRRHLLQMRACTIPQKAEKYRTLIVKRLVFYNLVNDMALIGLFLCGSMNYLLFSGISVLLILLSKPNETKLKIDLSLNEKEIQEFEQLKFEKTWSLK